MLRAEIVGLSATVAPSLFRDLGVRPGRCLDHPAAPDDVVRPARQRPAADRWMQRDRLAVVGDVPIGRRDRRHHLLATSAATAVRGAAILERYVEHAGRELLGECVDETAPKLSATYVIVLNEMY